MPRIPMVLTGLLLLVTACIGSREERQVLQAHSALDVEPSQGTEAAPSSPTREEGTRLFSRYLNQAIPVAAATLAGLELEDRKLESCGSEYAPLLRLGLDAFIAKLERDNEVPFSLKCQPLPIRQDLQVCDFPPIPAMPLSNDCRNQLAMLRIRLVMQLEPEKPLESLPAILLAHRLVAEVMSGDLDQSLALTLCNRLLALEPQDLDAHGLRVLLIFLAKKTEEQSLAFEDSLAKLEHSKRLASRSFAHLMEFNAAHLAMIKAQTPDHNARLQKAATQLADLAPHPLAGREAEAIAAFYRGDRGEAIRIMREASSLPLADGNTQESLKKLEEGASQPFKIRMFYSIQF